MAWQELGLGGGLCLVHDVFVCLVIEPKKPIAIICRSVWVEWQQGGEEFGTTHMEWASGFDS